MGGLGQLLRHLPRPSRARSRGATSRSAPSIRTRSGFALRYFGGYGHIIAGDLVCDPPATSCGPYYQNDGYNLIYIGVAVGYSF